MRRVANGRQSFSILRERNLFYIDKSLFLRDWYHAETEVTLITRPRRFGKTLNLDMVRCFFSLEYADRKDLFKGLKISRYAKFMTLQGTIPVIYVSFANEKPENYPAFLHMLASVLSKLYTRHRYLLDGDVLSEDEKALFLKNKNVLQSIPSTDFAGNQGEEGLTTFISRQEEAIRWLSIWMERYHGKKVIILMDEYDTPLQSAYLNGYWTDAIAIIRTLFGKTFKTNPAMDRALITGITRISKESLFSDTNHVTVSSVMTDEYTEYFGFTQEEVHRSLKEFKLLHLEDRVRDWYDGFTFGKRTDMYSPWSICCFLYSKNHALEPYWAQSGGLGLVDDLMRKSSPQVVRNLKELLLGHVILSNIDEELVFSHLRESPEAIWSLLLSSGYIRLASEHETTPEFVEEAQGKQVLKLTNREMKECFQKLARQWLVGNQMDYLDEFLKGLLRHDPEQMQEALQGIVNLCISSFDLGTQPGKQSHRNQPEKYFQGLMTGLTAGLMNRFEPSSNDESGDRHYDMALESKGGTPEVHIFEFKVFDPKQDQTVLDTANRALRQILEKRYAARFLAKGYAASQIYCYGIGFKGKHVKCVCGGEDETQKYFR